ncbi:MAG: hypothetical protein A2946_00865 [Candidatus Liptonbacteria bacterium RIFCSPLOWO2_01_FULL_53_13]|uniref:Prepilin-type N-terminal cleavage/methylation domain-containing protein n=1 Tax=Candidatus Liptonbacteria bacterium RIFCSPLOWO2_01_FULL_53_13 TaxID=1798651 RepID=A0A1G2CGJ3_9BACT|nr:MAG: hypothetical protein A2946_00865 [Candidatus Liptonbacteria bacterium RIFCSPLOWO2_01_FULL_53_13]
MREGKKQTIRKRSIAIFDIMNHMDTRRGFTVLELIVAIGVFLIVVTVAVGGLVRALRTIRETAEILSANSNASLALEQMSREMRTGYDFCIPANPCASEGEIIFRNARKDLVTYYLQEETIERSCVPGTSTGCEGTYAITAANIRIRHLSFKRFGADPGDGYQPRITIAVGASGKGAGIENIIVNLQTTVSPRLPLDS